MVVISDNTKHSPFFIDIGFLTSLCFRFAAFLRIDIRGLTDYYYYQYIDRAMDIVNSYLFAALSTL